MSATVQQSDASVSTTEQCIELFVDWREHSKPDEPTEEELQKAREKTLDLGNRTEIHYRADEVPKRRTHSKKADHQKEKYYRLDQHNRDNIWKWRTDVNVQGSQDFQFNRYTILAIGSQLGLSDLERQKAFEKLFALDLQRMGLRMEGVAFCVCALVSNQDSTERYENGDRIYHPQRNDENNPPAFVELQNHLIDSFGTISKKSIQSIFQKLEQENVPIKDKKEDQDLLENSAIVDRHPSYSPEGTKAPAKHPTHVD